MRQLKRLLLLVLGLTFLGGVGTGAWIGTLLAARSAARMPSVERRVEDFKEHFDLDATQERQLRAVLDEYDHRKTGIRERLTAEQLRQIRALEEASRERIRLILTGSQRTDYDKLVGSR